MRIERVNIFEVLSKYLVGDQKYMLNKEMNKMCCFHCGFLLVFNRKTKTV